MQKQASADAPSSVLHLIGTKKIYKGTVCTQRTEGGSNKTSPLLFNSHNGSLTAGELIMFIRKVRRRFDDSTLTKKKIILINIKNFFF